jgi:adenylate cyclase class 2
VAATEHLEVEVKFWLPDLAGLRAQLLAVGAQLVKPRVFERNLRLDTPDERLLQQQQLLRLRQDTAVRLTFKGEDEAAQLLSEAKVREELEMEVGDLDTAVRIFTRLGFVPVQVYEKYRETFQWQGVEIVLDELPYGNFVELEGEESAIKQVAQQLGLPWERRVVDNYLNLMARLQQQAQLPFRDLTFANFATVDVSIAAVLE